MVAVALFGGMALYLLAHIAFRLRNMGTLNVQRLVAAVVLLALIPVGAYEPRWFMGAQHVNPEEAVQVHADIGAARSLGIHWGTFNLTDEPLDQPPQDLARARRAKSIAEDRFFLLAIGASRALPARQP